MKCKNVKAEFVRFDESVPIGISALDSVPDDSLQATTN
jgi:hypothetical protein